MTAQKCVGRSRAQRGDFKVLLIPLARVPGQTEVKARTDAMSTPIELPHKIVREVSTRSAWASRQLFHINQVIRSILIRVPVIRFRNLADRDARSVHDTVQFEGIRPNVFKSAGEENVGKLRVHSPASVPVWRPRASCKVCDVLRRLYQLVSGLARFVGQAPSLGCTINDELSGNELHPCKAVVLGIIFEDETEAAVPLSILRDIQAADQGGNPSAVDAR